MNVFRVVSMGRSRLSKLKMLILDHRGWEQCLVIFTRSYESAAPLLEIAETGATRDSKACCFYFSVI